MRVIGLPCPHCQYKVRAVKSRAMSAMFKEITYICQNPDCGHVFVAGLEVLRTSAMPKPDIRIPMSQHARAAATSHLAFDLTAC